MSTLNSLKMNLPTYLVYRLVGISSNLLLVAFGWQWVVAGFKESSYLLALSVGCAIVEKTIEKINNEVVKGLNSIS